MKKGLILLAILLTSTYPLRAQGEFFDYQNYNHGYCPECQCTDCHCNPHQGNCPNCPNNAPPPNPGPGSNPCPRCNPNPAPASCPNCPRNPAPPIPPPPDSYSPSPTSCEPCSGANPCPSCGGNAPCGIPRAPISGTECGVSIWAIGLAIAAVAAAAAIIVSSGNGSASARNP